MVAMAEAMISSFAPFSATNLEARRAFGLFKTPMVVHPVYQRHVADQDRRN